MVVASVVVGRRSETDRGSEKARVAVFILWAERDTEGEAEDGGGGVRRGEVGLRWWSGSSEKVRGRGLGRGIAGSAKEPRWSGEGEVWFRREKKRAREQRETLRGGGRRQRRRDGERTQAVDETSCTH